MKVLFLDIDGVLVNEKSCHNAKKVFLEQFNVILRVHDPIYQVKSIQANKECVSNFNKVLEEIPELKIVISSSWRILFDHSDLCFILDSWGIESSKVIGRTKKGRNRGEEISEWLNEFSNEIESFVIVDDDNFDSIDLSTRLVRTTWQEGFCESHIKKTIDILNVNL